MTLLAAAHLRADPPELPGPALDVPVEVDGDGVSTYGDVWVFNHWLSLGGSLDKALAHSLEPGDGKTIDLSAFFASSAARQGVRRSYTSRRMNSLRERTYATRRGSATRILPTAGNH